MVTKTLSQKIFEIVGDNPDSFDKAKELQVEDLLKPISHEIGINDVKWCERKSSW